MCQRNDAPYREPLAHAAGTRAAAGTEARPTECLNPDPSFPDSEAHESLRDAHRGMYGCGRSRLLRSCLQRVQRGGEGRRPPDDILPRAAASGILEGAAPQPPIADGF